MDYSALPYDILHQICLTLRTCDFSGLKVFSQTDKRTRSACIPQLFHSVAYIRQWGPEKIQWEGLTESVKALKQNPTILGVIQSVHIKPWIGKPEQQSYPKEFFDLIFTLDNLTDLSFSIQKECTEQVESTLRAFHDPSTPAARRIISTVTCASIRSYRSLFLLEYLPAVTNPEIKESESWGEEFDLAKIAALCPSITRFHYPLSGTEEFISAVAHQWPNITDLGFSGSYVGKSGNANEHIRAFSKLKHLETLTLPHAMFLEPGDDFSWFGFGCCESDSDDEENAAQWERDKAEAEHRLIDIIERDIVVLPDCALSRVVFGCPNYEGQNVWEKRSDGRLLRSKALEYSNDGRRIAKITELHTDVMEASSKSG